MRLVIATDNFLPRWDGIARFLAEIIPRIDDEITVISPNYGSSHLDDQITRVLIPLQQKQYGDYQPAQWSARKVRNAIKKADLVFTQTIGPIGILANRYARRYQKPLIAFIHSLEWELFPRALGPTMLRKFAYPFTKLLTKYLYNRCDLLIVPSANIGDMLTFQGITTKKRVVHLGVNIRNFVKWDRAAARKQLGLPERATIIGFHGRIGHEKNLLTLARAFARLPYPAKRLLLIGDGVDSLKQRLRKIPNVMLVGSQENVVPYLQAMDIYVMPSYTETTSLAALEAMACELPVISSPVGFIQQYITHGENGLFFDTRNSYDLLKKIEQLAEDPARREQLGKAARRLVRKEFDWTVTAERLVDALHHVRRD